MLRARRTKPGLGRVRRRRGKESEVERKLTADAHRPVSQRWRKAMEHFRFPAAERSLARCGPTECLIIVFCLAVIAGIWLLTVERVHYSAPRQFRTRYAETRISCLGWRSMSSGL